MVTPMTMLDPNWTPERGYSHAQELLAILERSDMEKAQIITAHPEVEKLKRNTTPIPGRPGWRIDAQGKEWYSAAWLEPQLRKG